MRHATPISCNVLQSVDERTNPRISQGYQVVAGPGHCSYHNLVSVILILVSLNRTNRRPLAGVLSAPHCST